MRGKSQSHLSPKRCSSCSCWFKSHGVWSAWVGGSSTGTALGLIHCPPTAYWHHAKDQAHHKPKQTRFREAICMEKKKGWVSCYQCHSMASQHSHQHQGLQLHFHGKGQTSFKATCSHLKLPGLSLWPCRLVLAFASWFSMSKVLCAEGSLCKRFFLQKVLCVKGSFCKRFFV